MAKEKIGVSKSKLGDRGSCECGGFNKESKTQSSTFQSGNDSSWQGTEIKGKKSNG